MSTTWRLRDRGAIHGSMAGAALVAYLSSLCSPAFTATQYALLSSLASLGHNVVASSSGVLAEKFGWAPFFALTSVVSCAGTLSAGLDRAPRGQTFQSAVA